MNSILYVGIDVSKESNQVHAMNYNQKRLLYKSFPNSESGADNLEDVLLKLLHKHEFKSIQIVLETTGVYSAHIATYLSASSKLMPYNVLVYLINPKISKNYRKSFSDMDKTDPKDAFVLADLARVDRLKLVKPFRGSQRLALSRLTRHRFHYAELLSKEKTYVLNNIFLKFSDFNNVFSNNFGATAVKVLLEFKTIDEIINSSLEELTDFLISTSKNKFKNPELIAKELKAAARNSYRLDKMAYDSINISIASSMNLITFYEREIKALDKQILHLVKGLNDTPYKILKSIPGIGPVYAAGLLAEIGEIDQFPNDAALAKYAGLTWRKRESGNYVAQQTKMTKTGNMYLRYFLIQSANLIRQNNAEYNLYFNKKFKEVKKYQFKRAFVLTARKLVRLIHSLLRDNRLFQE